MILGLTALAYAQPTAPAPRRTTTGFRVSLPAEERAEARVAFVTDFDGPSIVEATLRAQVGWPVVSFAVELPAAAAATDSWSDAGLGNLVLDGRILFGRSSTHALGVRGTLPVGMRAWEEPSIQWWGTVPLATIPTVGLAIAYEGAVDRWVWSVRSGFQLGDLFDVTLPDLSAGVATIQPIAGPLAVVVEVEALLHVSPLHVRTLARLELGGWSADLGLAAPIPAMFEDPSLQVLGAVRRQW